MRKTPGLKFGLFVKGNTPSWQSGSKEIDLKIKAIHLLPFVFYVVLLAFFGCRQKETSEAPLIIDEEVRKEIYFQIQPDRPLRFEARPELEEIRIVSVLEVAPKALVDEYLYGIRVRILRGKETIWDRTFYERTRLSQLEDADGKLLLDIRDPSGNISVTDRRVTDIFLGQATKEGDYIELFLVASVSPRSYVRVYQKKLLSLEEVEKEWKRMNDEDRKERMAISAVPPSMLNDKELFQLLRKTYLTLPPEGVGGKDYTKHNFILREDPITYRDYLYGDQATEFTVGGGRQMVINICGKGTIRFSFPGFVPPEGSKPQVTVMTVNEHIGQAIYKKPLLSLNGEYRIDIPTRDGCTSLILDYPYPDPVAVRAYYLEDGAEDIAENWRQQVPNYLSSRDYICRPLDDPTVLPNPIYSDIPKGQEYIIVKSLIATGPEEVPPENYSYHYSFHNSDNDVLTEGDIESEVTTAAFVRFPAGGNLAEMLPSEPLLTYFAVPKGAKTLSVLSDGPVLFSFMTTSVSRKLLKKAVPEDKQAIIINKDDIDYEPQWFYIRPANFQKLEIDGRCATSMTQKIQIIIIGTTFAGRGYEGIGLWPQDASAKIAVMESAKVNPWLKTNNRQDWYRPIHPSMQTTLNIPEQTYSAAPASTEVYFQCPQSSGQPPALSIDNVPVRPLVNSSTLISTGALLLEPGEKQIGLAGCSKGLGFVRLPETPAAGDAVATARGYFRLKQGEVMELPFRKPAGRKVAVNLIFYSNDPGLSRSVVEALVTPGDRQASYAYEPPPYKVRQFSISRLGPEKGACMHFTGCHLGARQAMAIPLNSWYPPGDYLLSLRLLEGSSALVRCFIYSRPEKADPLRAFYRE